MLLPSFANQNPLLLCVIFTSPNKRFRSKLEGETMRFEVNCHLVLFGTKKDVQQSLQYLKDEIAACLGIDHAREGEARIMIQNLMEQKLVTADVLLNGNSVYNKTKILRNIRMMVRHEKMSLMTNYTYEFLSNACGSIAHWNKAGWISFYPTIAAFRDFFIKNEYGKRVLESRPAWATDRVEIIKEIESILGISSKKGM